MHQIILDLLSGKKIDDQPAFSGLIHITAEGLKSEGLSLHEIHKDAKKMAKAAASAFKLTGIPSATLPLDLCAPAEAIGAELNFEGEGFPQVKKAAFESVNDLLAEFIESDKVLRSGRIPMICDAIRLVKEDIGKEIVISGLIPGPYTLLLYLCNPKNLFIEMKKEPDAVRDALFLLSSILSKIGQSYTEAGADFITIHDMGGSPGFIGPAKYEQFVFPSEKALIKDLPKPVILSICGDATKSLHLIGQAGASAVSLDQTVDMSVARAALKDTLLFGNIDPVGVLQNGDAAQVVEAVRKAKDAGVDAIWPGCDLVLQTPTENIKAMIQ